MLLYEASPEENDLLTDFLLNGASGIIDAIICYKYEPGTECY